MLSRCGRTRLSHIISGRSAQQAADLRRRFGPNPRDWQWGRVQHVYFHHAFGQQRPLEEVFSQGPFALGGDADTVAQTSVLPDAPAGTNPVSVSTRHVVDLGNMEGGLAMFAPGQSGHLASPHYGDLVRPWLDGEYFPMTLDEATDSGHQILTLSPPISAE